MDHACPGLYLIIMKYVVGVLLAEFLMGVQPWWKSKSMIALSLVLIGFSLGLALSPFSKLLKGRDQ